MITLLFEFLNWIKNREYRNELATKPYFWGEPSSKEGHKRYTAFLRASGLEEI